MRHLPIRLCTALAVLLTGCNSTSGGNVAPASFGVVTSSSGNGAAGSPIALYVLVPDDGLTTSLGQDVYRDARLDNGELFLIAQDALDPSTTYKVEFRITIDATTTFVDSWEFTTGTATVTTAGTSDPIDELNEFRTQALASGLTVATNYAKAATRHSGYQCETDDISHGEDDNTAAFFVSDDLGDRISIAHGGTAGSFTWGGSDIVYETIATNGDEAAVDSLWNTVYHRLPMMREHATVVGAGDRTEAMLDSIYTSTIPAPFTGLGGTNQQYMTIEYGADSSIAQVGQIWPADGQLGVGTTFNTDTELPDPVGNANGDLEDNGTPTDNVVGTPIHGILPTTGKITAISVKLSIVP